MRWLRIQSQYLACLSACWLAGQWAPSGSPWEEESYKVSPHLSCSVVSDSATPWTVAFQAPLSMEFSRQEYWSGLLFPPPADLPNPGIKPASLTSPALAGGFFTTSATWETQGEWTPMNILKAPARRPPLRLQGTLMAL